MASVMTSLGKSEEEEPITKEIRRLYTEAACILDNGLWESLLIKEDKRWETRNEEVSMPKNTNIFN